MDGRVSLSAEAAERADQASLMRRSISGFDWAITGLWTAITVFFTFMGFSKNIPQETKVTMAPGLLLVVFSVAFIARKAFARVQNRNETNIVATSDATK